MFISEKEARERLEDSANIFRQVPSSIASLIQDAPAATLPASRPASSEDDYSDEDGPVISFSHLDSLINPKKNGRASYANHLENQVAVGETALILGNERAGQLMELSPSQASAYAQGLRSIQTENGENASRPKPELRKRMTIIKERLAEQAAHRLGLTLAALSPEKISSIKRATNISKVAKDMSVILEKCTEKEKTDSGGVHFHVYRPEMHNETNYNTVNVGPAIVDV